MKKHEKPNIKKHPNTFIIGFEKCGTTAMSTFLKQHPEVYFSSNKEPNYYTNDLLKKKESFTDYMNLFNEVDTSKVNIRSVPSGIKIQI